MYLYISNNKTHIHKIGNTAINMKEIKAINNHIYQIHLNIVSFETISK